MSAEIAMSGSYFDDVLLDPQRYGIENATDKLRRPGAVRRRRDTVCTGSIVGHSYGGRSRGARRGAFLRVPRDTPRAMERCSISSNAVSWELGQCWHICEMAFITGQCSE
jgi:hypothetical protein